VGFISDLPIQLVEAFHATLEEVAEADLLVHVIDCTAPNLDEHRSTVLQVLKQIGVTDEKLKNMIEVWNKIDHSEEETDLEEIVNDGENNEPTEISDEEGNEILNVDSQDDQNPIDKDVEPTEQGDYSDSWLSEDDDVEDQDGIFKYWKSLENGQIESANQWMVPQGGSGSQVDSQSQDEHAPDIKISAITGVGLQELLELVDKRLDDQSDKPKNGDVDQRDIFHRKWRPSRTEDSSIAVEQ
jgi:50S ribosomal subunit-associated GTPase HflX